MISISYQKLKYAAVLYTVIPLVIFFIGWLNIVSAILFTALLLAAAIISFLKRSEEDGEYTSVSISAGVLLFVAVLSVIWCYFAGQGGFVHQTDDHQIRNMIITDLTLKEWPVTYKEGQNLLSYYIAYWMVPCSLGRAVFLTSGDTTAALYTSNILLLIQSSIGVFLTFLLTILITQAKGKYYPVLAVLIFIFFSGLDTIGIAISDEMTRRASLEIDHLEWWGGFFQFSSNTTCLYWVYNQTVPVWPLLLCLMNEKRLKDFALLAVLVFPYGPFPFVGLMVFCLIKAGILLRGAAKQNKLAEEVRVMLSPQNFLIVFAIAPVFILYFTANGVVANTSGGEEVNTGFRLHNAIVVNLQTGNLADFRLFWLKYVEFIILEVGVFTALLLVKYRKHALVIGTTILLMLCPMFQIGYKTDFAMRVSIPGLVYLCVMMIRLVISEMPEKGEIRSLDDFARKKTVLMLACFVLMLGTATPVTEITREALFTFEAAHPDPMMNSQLWSKFDYDNLESLEDVDQDANFFAVDYQNSSFYRYFCKH